MLLNPKSETFAHLDATSRKLLLKTVAFFENRGKAKLKHDDHERVWYADFLEFAHKEQLFSTFLTPQPWALTKDQRWDTYRICALNEILSFYGLAYWYTWQVTILGLGPIWMGTNDAVKHKTAQLLTQGGIFSFGLSEKEHGADIYSSDMILTPQDNGNYTANGGKYYIGNANKAALVTTFGKFHDSENYVFFVVDPQHDKYQLIKNVVNSQNYVAEFALHQYPISEKDILAKGRDAWDCALNTVNLGKFNLGWASIGICSHAYYEAINHASHRRLFNHYVTDFVHVKHLFVDAYTRLIAMKLFASRGIDYMRSASPDDRRYLLFTPMAKMKVTTQGEEVMNQLWDVIAAKGFEKDMYFEMAVKDIRALPKLEGTVQVNMALIIKFMANYFFKPGKFSDIPTMDHPANDDFLFNQGATKGLSKIRFHDYRKAYDSVDSPNIKVFKQQIRMLKLLLIIAKPNKQQITDFHFLLNLGELFTLVVYGHLIIEQTRLKPLDEDLFEQIFAFMVRDFSKYALELFSSSSCTLIQRQLCRRMIRPPVVDKESYERVWQNYAFAMKDQYEMAP
jgi:acyl-CoA dehydrogenase